MRCSLVSAILVLGLIAIAGSPCEAGDYLNDGVVQEASQATDGPLIPTPVLFEGGKKSWIQKISLNGIYHGTYANVSSNAGKHSDFENRIWRLGVDVKFLSDWQLHADINVNDEFDPFYGSLNDVYLAYQPSDTFRLKLGKMKPLWGSQWRQSIKSIPYFEWGQLVNQLRPNRAMGVSVDGHHGNWMYEAGVWSGHINAEFGNFNGGAFYTGSIGYDFSDLAHGLDQLEWHLDFYLNETQQGSGALPNVDQALSTYIHLSKGAFRLTTDVMVASGNAPDAYGLVLAPGYQVTEKLEIVGRYQYSRSASDILLLENRYDRFPSGLADGGRGSEAHSVYVGANYAIDQDRLKLLSGVKWSTMNDRRGDGGDFDGWTFFAGGRISF